MNPELIQLRNSYMILLSIKLRLSLTSFMLGLQIPTLFKCVHLKIEEKDNLVRISIPLENMNFRIFKSKSLKLSTFFPRNETKFISPYK